MIKKNYRCKITAVVLAVCAVLSMADVKPVQAAAKTISVETAKATALAESSQYSKLESKLELNEAQYAQAIKKIQLKEKNQRSFRWSPLLNFKLPEQPDLSDEFEYTYKPLELTSEKDELRHQLNDCVYGVYEKVELAFVNAYKLQEKIRFNQERIETGETALEKNKVRLAAGLASQSDIDSLEKNLQTLNNTLASDMRSFDAQVEKLSDMVGFDLTGYTFEDPFVAAGLDRDILDKLIEYTIENDDSFYQTQKATSNALLALDTNYKLMKQQYGNKMSMIDSYINQAKKGEKLNAAAFKKRYGELLNAVDQPWTGYFKIWFVKIPKEWLKGSIDGVRYVEDEPYALYEAALEYQDCYREEQSQKEELTTSVKDSYENYVSAKNSCENLQKQLQKQEKTLEKSKILNTAGKISYEEYTQVQDEYEQMQMDLLEAQASYSEILYSFDRLTCGAVSVYLDGSTTALNTAGGGVSYVVEENGTGVYYYIHDLVSGNMFEIGLSIPEDFEPQITDYELWINGEQIGDRTKADETIHHLTLDLDRIDSSFIRLYSGNKVIDDCSFDATVNSGELTVTSYKVETTSKDQLGTYSLTTDSTLGTCTLSIELAADVTASYYNIRTKDGNYLVSDDKIDIHTSFRYLAALKNSLDDLVIDFYDADQKLLYEAVFQTNDQTIQKMKEE